MWRFMAPRCTSTQRVYQTRERRRRGQALATIRVDRIERQKLVELGYLDRSLLGADKGPALDVAVEAYLSDRLAAEAL